MVKCGVVISDEIYEKKAPQQWLLIVNTLTALSHPEDFCWISWIQTCISERYFTVLNETSVWTSSDLPWCSTIKAEVILPLLKYNLWLKNKQQQQYKKKTQQKTTKTFNGVSIKMKIYHTIIAYSMVCSVLMAVEWKSWNKFSYVYRLFWIFLVDNKTQFRMSKYTFILERNFSGS